MLKAHGAGIGTVYKFLKNLVSGFFVFLIRGAICVYQYVLSPLLPPRCRFLPTCSAYASEVITRHGLVKGMQHALKRVCRCHPWGGSGHDPVP